MVPGTDKSIFKIEEAILPGNNTWHQITVVVLYYRGGAPASADWIKDWQLKLNFVHVADDPLVREQVLLWNYDRIHSWCADNFIVNAGWGIILIQHLEFINQNILPCEIYSCSFAAIWISSFSCFYRDYLYISLFITANTTRRHSATYRTGLPEK